MPLTTLTSRARRALWYLCWVAPALTAGVHTLAAQARADSTGRPPDTTRAAAAPQPAAPPPAPPVDTVLVRACQYGKNAGSAPGVLGVLFRARSTDKERAAAAAEVGGKVIPLGGREAYVRIQENGMSLRDASGRLIGSSAVSAVSEIPCPG
ncbi:MAG: hypothetical protein ACREOQ_08430 [Gemmatimonadales bacterium]